MHVHGLIEIRSYMTALVLGKSMPVLANPS